MKSTSKLLSLALVLTLLLSTLIPYVNAEETSAKDNTVNISDTVNLDASSERTIPLDFTDNTSTGWKSGCTQQGTLWTNTTENWSYDTNQNIITLSGVQFNVPETNDCSFALRLPDKDTKIISKEGTVNNIKIGANKTENTKILYAITDAESKTVYNHTIEGSGKLNLTSGNTSGYVSACISFHYSSLTLKNTSIFASSETSTLASYGIASNKYINISGGNVTAVSGSGANFTSAIAAVNDIDLSDIGNISISDGATINACSQTAKTNSIAIFSNDININKSYVTAESSYAGGNTEEYEASMGLYAYNTLTANNSTITAIAGDAADESAGISADKDITITGGTITAVSCNKATTDKYYSTAIYSEEGTIKAPNMTAKAKVTNHYIEPVKLSDNNSFYVLLNNPEVLVTDIKITDENSIHTITASAGEGGTISPSGTITVDKGINKTFTIEPSNGYNIKDVLVDGTSIGAKTKIYTFEKVTANHTISASFEKKPVSNGEWKQTADGKWQYIVNGECIKGWRSNISGWEGQWFYFDTAGIMQTGWKNDIPNWNGSWFYFNSLGVMQTNWQNNIPGWEGQWFFFDEFGVMRTSWQNNIPSWEGQWFFFNTSGVMLTGWQNNIPNWVNSWFYFNASGVMQTGLKGGIPGWGNSLFYFDHTTGVMQTGAQIIDGETWIFDTNGVCISKPNGDFIIVLDPGRGGDENGTSSVHDGVLIKEKDLNMTIASNLKNILQNYKTADGRQVKVYLTRDTDVNVGIKDRVLIAKNLDAQVMFSIHCNASSDGSKDFNGSMGLITSSSYIASGSRFNDIYNAEYNIAASVLRNLGQLGIARSKDPIEASTTTNNNGFLRRVSDSGKTYPNGDTCDWYGIIRYGIEYGMPSLLIEHAYVDNDKDYYNYLSDDNKLANLAAADAKGLIEYYGLIG